MTAEKLNSKAENPTGALSGEDIWKILMGEEDAEKKADGDTGGAKASERRRVPESLADKEVEMGNTKLLIDGWIADMMRYLEEQKGMPAETDEEKRAMEDHKAKVIGLINERQAVAMELAKMGLQMQDVEGEAALATLIQKYSDIHNERIVRGAEASRAEKKNKLKKRNIFRRIKDWFCGKKKKDQILTSAVAIALAGAIGAGAFAALKAGDTKKNEGDLPEGEGVEDQVESDAGGVLEGFVIDEGGGAGDGAEEAGGEVETDATETDASEETEDGTGGVDDVVDLVGNVGDLDGGGEEEQEVDTLAEMQKYVQDGNRLMKADNGLAYNYSHWAADFKTAHDSFGEAWGDECYESTETMINQILNDVAQDHNVLASHVIDLAIQGYTDIMLEAGFTEMEANTMTGPELAERLATMPNAGEVQLKMIQAYEALLKGEVEGVDVNVEAIRQTGFVYSYTESLKPGARGVTKATELTPDMMELRDEMDENNPGGRRIFERRNDKGIRITVTEVGEGTDGQTGSGKKYVLTLNGGCRGQSDKEVGEITLTVSVPEQVDEKNPVPEQTEEEETDDGAPEEAEETTEEEEETTEMPDNNPTANKPKETNPENKPKQPGENPEKKPDRPSENPETKPDRPSENPEEKPGEESGKPGLQPKNSEAEKKNSGANDGIVKQEGQEGEKTQKPAADSEHPFDSTTGGYDYTPEEVAKEVGMKVGVGGEQVADSKVTDAGADFLREAWGEKANNEAGTPVAGTIEGADVANDFDAGASVATGEVTKDTGSASGNGTIEERQEGAVNPTDVSGQEQTRENLNDNAL